MEGRGCARGNLSFCERKVSPGPPSKESRFYAVRPAEGGAGGVGDGWGAGIIRAGESGACTRPGGNLSFCERKVSPGPPSKESRFYAVRPAEGGAGGAGTDGGRGLSEQANQKHVCGGETFLSAKERFPPDPLPKKAAFTPSAPRRAGRAARGRMECRGLSEQANQEHVCGRGKPFFLRKKGFPRAPFQRKPLLRRPPRGGRGGRREDGWMSGIIRSGESGACMRRCRYKL